MRKYRLVVGIDRRLHFGAQIEHVLRMEYDNPEFVVLPINCPGEYQSRADVERGAERVLRAIYLQSAEFYLGVCRVLIKHHTDAAVLWLPLTAALLVDSAGEVLVDYCEPFGYFTPWPLRESIRCPPDILDTLATMVRQHVGPGAKTFA